MFFLNINKQNLQVSRIVLIGVITTPIFLFLISSPKPQLMQIVNSLFCSFLIYQIYRNRFSNSTINYLVYLIIFLLTLNILVKYSFLLSFCLIGLTLIITLIRLKKFKILVIPIFIALVLLIVPKFLFYNKYFDTSLSAFFTSHLPINLFLYNEIHDSLKAISDGNRLFPSWLIIPKSLGYGGTIIGPLILSFFLFKFEKKKINLLIYSSLIFFNNSFGLWTSNF